MTFVRARAPGRVNLIGDHTDYTGGLVLPLAVDLETTITGERGGDRVILTSTSEAGRADLSLAGRDPDRVQPQWARYVAGVIAVMQPGNGFVGRVTTTVPVGAGLSSSAALEVAVALAVGFEGRTQDLARVCQEAERRASGVPCGIMDQLVSASGVGGAALLIDCTTLEVDPVPIPDNLEVLVVHSGIGRRLADTRYAERRSQCEAAAEQIGPLRTATLADVAAMNDPILQRRARHVVSENQRVQEFATALRSAAMDDLAELMAKSHASLRHDFEVTVPEVDNLVSELTGMPGVIGARQTGAGFGGCVVVLAERGADLPGRRVQASPGASVEVGR